MTGVPKVVGHTAVRGVPVTEYEGTVSISREVRHDFPPAQARTLLQAEKALGLSDNLPTTVWLDSKGRVRRITSTDRLARLPAPSDGGTAGASPTSGGPSITGRVTITLTTEYYAFGLRVTVAPPPPDQTETWSAFQAAEGKRGA